MNELPTQISDLALILILAGGVSLIFKRLRQPLVLGYIVAGFCASKHMPYMPSVVDTHEVEAWSQIGVIFLMFTLGLEFSFKKILSQGPRPVITALLVMYAMMAVGETVGELFGWSRMDSIFLGGMLAMSSTTIIFKAFSDLGLKQKPFASKVLSVLVLEDILGILLMVMLSGLAVSQTLEGEALATSLLQLGFFLVLWFVVGIFIVPTLLRRTRRLISNESLLIVSIACCFLMVVLAAQVGYSTAFGAFMMGSILAETVEAERIERLVAPVRDLFGAIFFVSVGMLADPKVLVEYWPSILILTLCIVLGQGILGSASFLLTGHSLRTSVQCGFSLAQVGEFAFIIASMGTAMGVTSGFLYPVIVAVSIITTFLTPYMIRLAQRIPLPSLVLRRPHVLTTHTGRGSWKRLLRALATQVAIYSVLALAVTMMLVGSLLLPLREMFGHWPGNIVCGTLLVLLLSPFLRAIVMRKNHSEEWKTIARRGLGSRLLLMLTFAVRYAIATAFIFYVIEYLSPYRFYWHILIAALILAVICASHTVKQVSRRMEGLFRRNLAAREGANEAQEATLGELQAFAQLFHSEDEHKAPVRLQHIVVSSSHSFCGKALRDSRLREEHSSQVVGLQRGEAPFCIPEADLILQEGDILWIVKDARGN